MSFDICVKPSWGPQTDTQEEEEEDEEEEDVAPAAAAEKQAQPVGEDEELKLEWTACVNACVVRP